MKNALNRRIIVLGILCLLTLFAAGPGVPSAEANWSDDPCGPGYCIGNCYCDNCLCYAPETEISQRYCGGGGALPE